MKGSSFGLISGIATTIGFLPHIVALLFIAVTGDGVGATPVFILFTIGTRFLGDWLFWGKMFPKEMDTEENGTNWRSSVKNILFAQPIVIRSLIDMVIDIGVDAILIYTALQMSASPVWIFLVFTSCQAVVALIHGTILIKRNVRVLSLIVAAVTVTAVLVIKKIPELSAIHTIIFIVLGAECLLTGTTVIAKATIAEVIRLEVTKESSKL